METQYRSSGRHRLAYRPREDPIVEGAVRALCRRLAEVVAQGVDAVSPLQSDPDGHRRRVTIDLTGALLTQVFRLVAGTLAQEVQRRVPSLGGLHGAVAAGATQALKKPLRPPDPVIDLTDRADKERPGG